MIVHVVMIKFNEDTPNNKRIEIKKRIEDLTNHIPQIDSMEVGLNFADEDRAMDLVLISKFKTIEDLDIYAKDDTHQELIRDIKEVAQYTKVVDYRR